MAGDPAALARIAAVWAHGWARSRATPAPRAVPGGFRIEVGRPRHAARYVLPAADPAVLRDLVRTVTAPDIWLKICAPRDQVAPLLTGAWRYDEPQYLMTAPLPPSPPDTTPPPGYRLVTEECGGTLDVRIRATGRAAADRPAASGRTALTGGTDGAPVSAVHDLIGTEPAHRRRGLGRLVMAALTAHAVRRGAVEAVLVASPSGRKLYTALGWHLRAPVTAAVRERGEGRFPGTAGRPSGPRGAGFGSGRCPGRAVSGRARGLGTRGVGTAPGRVAPVAPEPGLRLSAVRP